MKIKYTDYLFTPADLWRGVLHVKNNFRLDDVIGLLTLIILFLYTKDYLFWQIDSTLFFLFLFVLFYWNLDSRISIGLALLTLTACPILLYLSSNYNFLEGEDWAERAAVWTYYFLVFGVAKQIWEFKKEGKKKEEDNTEHFDVVTEEDLEPLSEIGAEKVNVIFPEVQECSNAVIEHAMQKTVKERFLPHTMFSAIALAVMFPLFFKGGFVFLLDMVWGPNIQLSDYMSDGISSHFPLILIFKFFSFFLSVAFIEKALLATILFLCGFWMFNLAKNLMPRRWAILSGVFYVLNPYVFERFLTGHWLVLLGYAFFPVVIFLFLRFLKSNKRKNLVNFMLAFAIYPILSLHWAYIAFWFLFLVGIVYAVLYKYNTPRRLADATPLERGIDTRRGGQEYGTFDFSIFFSRIVTGFFGVPQNDKKVGHKILCPYGMQTKNLFGFVFLTMVIWLVVNSFWLGDFFGGSGILGKITLADFDAYRTMSDPVWGTFFNVLSLYGFWQDAFFLPKDVFAYWWVLTFVVIAFSFLGFIHLARKRSSLALATGIAFVPTLLIAVGYGSPFTRPLCDFLFYHFPGFSGLRETAKVTGVLAFAYALFFPLGIKLVVDRLSAKATVRTKKVACTFTFVCAIVFCCLLVNNMFFGFDGQVRSWPYPDSWYEVEEILQSDPQTETVLFLPWHGYPELAFADNATVANPARVFFSNDIVSGKNLDSVYLTDAVQGDWDGHIFDMVQGIKSLDDNLEFLKSEKVSYIILAKTADWERYGFLDQSQGMEKVFEAEEIVLYKVQ